ncbi:hypothetical protein [Synechococcus sp. CC9616]|uniref:hypothetical protein n=1 Tax=Synechococcus sp. CC9616 TaxID=110663 RepID=UPI00055DC9AC|nr:hypothetical protein [Synechococcus sp. CC9616]
MLSSASTLQLERLFEGFQKTENRHRHRLIGLRTSIITSCKRNSTGSSKPSVSLPFTPIASTTTTVAIESQVMGTVSEISLAYLRRSQSPFFAAG